MIHLIFFYVYELRSSKLLKVIFVRLVVELHIEMPQLFTSQEILRSMAFAMGM